ncbi:hypothetical protein ABPG74_019869 [Tetrahymena malaccensis]
MNKRQTQILGVTAGALSVAAMAWYVYKKKYGKQTYQQKIQKLLEKTIYVGFNKKLFSEAFQETASEINLKLEEIFSDKKFIGQISCSNYISNTRVGFYCLDCEGSPLIDSNQMAQCSDCFSKANHDGHRYSQINIDKTQISCKCGDSNFLKPQAYCKDHKGLTDEIEKEIRDLLQQNGELVNNFNKFWKGVFLQLFFIIENANKMSIGNQANSNIVSIIDQIFHEVVNLIKKNMCYAILFCDFLTSKIYTQKDLNTIKKLLMQQYTANPSNSQSDEKNFFKAQQNAATEDESIIVNRMLYHNCKNNQDISFYSTSQRMSSLCNCSYLENMIRFSSYIIPGITVVIQDVIINLQRIPSFKKFTSGILIKMLHFVEKSSKFLYSNISDYFNPYLLVQQFSYPVEYGCQMVLDMSQFANMFNILCKYIEGIILQQDQSQVEQVKQIFQSIKSLTSQSEVNFLILLTDTTFLENLLKTLAKIEKRGILSILGTQKQYVHTTQISQCLDLLLGIVYSLIRDLTFLADEVESATVIEKLKLYTQESNKPVAVKLKDIQKENLYERNQEILQFILNNWLINYESVQFDKKSISNMVNSRQDFISFSSLISMILYSVAYRDFKGKVELINKESIISTLTHYLENEKSVNILNSNSKDSKDYQEKIKALFVDLDSNIVKNNFCIFHKELQVQQLNQLSTQIQINQDTTQFNQCVYLYCMQWSNHNNEVILLLRQICLLITGEKLYNQFYDPFQKIVEQIELNGEPKKITALQIPDINSEINKFSENVCISFLTSYHIQFLKSNYIANSQTPLTLEKMDINLRSSIVQCIIQLFFFTNNSLTMSDYKLMSLQVIKPFQKLGVKTEEILILLADFDQKKKKFSLKKQYMPYGSNLHLWNQMSVYQQEFLSYTKNFNSEVTGTVQDILFVQEDFSFNKIVTIDNLTYQFNYLPSFLIINFTKFIASEKLIENLKSLFIGITNIPKNIFFLTFLQYIVYFIKESKHSPHLFADIEQQYKPSLFQHLYEIYIKSNLLQTFFLNIIQVKDTQNIQEGSKLLLKMINKIIQEEEGIVEDANNEGQELPLTAEEIEKQKEEQRKKKIEEAKRKQQEMLQKFAQQRNTFQQKQEGKEDDQKNEIVSENLSLLKKQSVVKNQENEAEYCSICSEQIEKNSEFGYPIYIKSVNTLNFLKQEKSSFDQNKQDDFYISVNSCGHFYHYTCWQDYQQKNSVRNERNAHLYRNESEIPCSLCKRLSNNFIQYIPESMRQRYSTKQLNKEKSLVYSSQKLKDTLKSITSSQIEQEEKINQEIIKFFDNIETAQEEVLEENLLKGDEEAKEESLSASTSQINSLSMSKTLSKSIMFTQNDFITNVQDYLTVLSISNPDIEKMAIQNLQQDAFEKIFLKPFHHIEFSEIQEFIQTHYKVYNNLLEYMRMNYTTQYKQKKSNKLEYLQNFLEQQKESNLHDLFLREILTYFCLSSILDPLHDINLFCQYFILILADSIKKEKKLQKLENINLVEVIKDDFQLQSHMGNLQHLLEYFLSFLCFRNIFSVQKLQQYDFCLISDYLELFNSVYSPILSKNYQFTSFQDILINFALENQQHLEQDFNFYTQKLKKNDAQLDKSIMALRLPDNFELFKRLVDKKRCAKCDRIPFSDETNKFTILLQGVSVCLLCGYSVCKNVCQKDYESKLVQKVGNLSQHAIDAHGGCCVFIDALVSNVTYLHYPKNVIQDSIYSSKYGEFVNKSTLNWNEYYLDSKANEAIRKAVIYNSVPETLFKYLNSYEGSFVYFKDYCI